MRKQGRSALGDWTVRVEQDGYYDSVAIPVVETVPLPELEGMTTQSYYNLRELPAKSSKLIGKLTGEEVFIRVDSKAKADGIVWYRISLSSPTGKTADGQRSLPLGTTGWITADAVTPVIGWDAFIAQLSAWEKAHGESDMGLNITLLRRMSHRSNLPFDKVIGRPEHGRYLDTQPFDPTQWNLLNDAQQVRTPDGKIVDMQHLFVGLDVLTNMKEDHTISEPGCTSFRSARTTRRRPGPATSAPAPPTRPRSSTRSGRRRIRKPRARTGSTATTTRARRTPTCSATSTPGASTRTVRRPMRRARSPSCSRSTTARRPCSPSTARRSPSTPASARAPSSASSGHYGFKLGAASLRSQTAPREAMAKQVKIFGRTWLFKRNAPFKSDNTDEMHDYADEMTGMFLDWLDMLALEVGAGT